MKEYNYIDLFAGAGGMTLGFDKAGFNNILAVEFDKCIAETYRFNFPNHNLIVEDIKNISNDEIKRIIGNSNIDVIIGGPPCQGFSIAGRIGRNFIDDERNNLFKEFVRFVKVIQPKIFVMENVSSLKTHNKGKTIKEIIKEFEKVGYTVKCNVLNAVNYGVPQHRRRIFVIGTLNNINKFKFPEKSNRYITIKEALKGLPELKSGETSDIPNHNAMNHSKQMLEKMSFVKDGGNRNDIPAEIRPKSGDIRKYIRYNSKKPSICITGDMRKVFHFDQNRALTGRELARIQTFPDEFIFKGNSGKIQQQIGNSVPPKLAYQIANSVKELLDNERISQD